MKKFFIFAAILVVAANLYFRLTSKGDIRTPYYEFKNLIGTASLETYRDNEFGYTIEYPDIFQQEPQQEGDSSGHTRFTYRNEANIILETYVMKNPSASIKACADSLTQQLHATQTIFSKRRSEHGSAFVLTGHVYENDVRINGYNYYAKFIKSGKTLFVYSLTYPDSYKPALSRLFNLIDNWRILGTY